MGSTDSRLVLVLLWQIGAASATVQCDSGIIVACTLGTVGGCALLVGVAVLIRWARSRRRRRAMFEGNPMIRSYSKLTHGTDNKAFVDDSNTTAAARSGSAGIRISQHDETSSTKAASQAHSRLVAVDLVSKDIIGLGFGIQGTYSDGIYISEVHDRGPAKGTGLVEVGDRIMSLTISTENMAYEDALALLSYATPYCITIQLLKRSSSGAAANAAAGSRDSRLLRKKDRGSMDTTARGRNSGTGLQPLRHPAFFGRSQSMDESLVNSCLPRAVHPAARLMSLGPPGFSQAKNVAPPPKPKRSMDLSRSGGSGSSSDSAAVHISAQTSRPMQQLLPPLEPVAEMAAAARLYVAADTGAGGSLPTEEPLPAVTIKPVFMSAGRLSSVADSPITVTAESSLLDDINQVLAHERLEPVLPMERRSSPVSVGDASQQEEIMYGEGEVPDGLFDWEVGSNVSSEQVKAVNAYIRAQGTPPPAYAATNIVSSSKLQPAATVATTHEVQPAAAAAAARFVQVGDEILPRDLLLDSATVEVITPLATAKEDHDSPDDCSICMSTGSPSIAGDDAYENDGRTSTPVRSEWAARLTNGNTAASESSEDPTSDVADAAEEQPVDLISSSGGLPWHPSSWSALLDDSGAAGHDASSAARPPSTVSSNSSNDGRARELPAPDICQSGHDKFTIVAIQREAVKPSHVIRPSGVNSDEESLPPPPAEWSSSEEANGFHWTADDCHFATRRISSATTISGDSDVKSSDSTGASRSRGSDDEVTPQPLRKFGNFANLSNDELDATDSGPFFNHMADRESVSSEYSTPVHSEHGNDSPKAFTYSGVDENLNQASKIAAGQADGQAPLQPADIGGASRRSIEEARALFFAELLQRSTH